MPALLADLRYALRRLGKTPGITTIAVLTLALGLGASTAMFTLTWNIVLKSLPVPRPKELVEYSLSNGVSAGLFVGSFLAVLLTQVLTKLFALPGAGTFAGLAIAALSLVCISAFSLIAPVRRAASTDPVIALRSE